MVEAASQVHALAPLIRDLAVILGFASIVALLFQKIHQPVVLGYLIAGVIIGPYTPPHTLVSDIPNIHTLSELGVIFLMFSLGLEFSFHKLKRVGFSASATGLVEVVLMLGIGMATGLAIGWSFHDSLFLGAALAISSTTIIIKALEELNLKNKRFAELVFGVLIIEDLMAILLLVALSTMVLTQKIFSLPMAWALGKLTLVVGGWFLLGYFLMPSVIRVVAKYISEEILTIVSVALCLFLSCLAAYFDYTAALGAFIMGSILAETKLVHRIELLVRPIRNIFAAVFFVSVGMLIDPKIIIAHFGLVMLITVITILGKVLTTSFGAFLTGQSIGTSLRSGFSMAQIGEFSFIIVGLGLALGVVSSTLYPIIVAVSAITTFLTPYLIKFSGYLDANISVKIPPRIWYFLNSYTSWIYRAQASSKVQTAYYKILTRLIINGLIVAIIFVLTENYILPRINQLSMPGLALSSLSWLCALIISSPFIWAMLTAFKSEEFEHPNRTVRTLPFFLSFFIPLLEVSVLSLAYFHNWFVAVLLIALAVIFFIFLFKKLEQSYAWFENHLIRNLTQNVTREVRYEELAPWDRHLVEIQVGRQTEYIGQTLRMLQLRQQYQINVIAIQRGSDVIFAPTSEQVIQAFDKLIVLGADDQIDAFRSKIAKENEALSDEIDLLASFALESLVLEEGSFAIGKSIRESRILERVSGLVVGLERDGRRILNPHSSTVLQQGDLLIIVGDSKNLNLLQKSN